MRPDSSELLELLPRLERLARDAGARAMASFIPGARTSAEISYKDGGSPVTQADLAVNRFLFEKLRELRPGVAWLSEETPDDHARLSQEHVFIIDPIDGTTAFIRGDQRWAISIAWVVNGRPLIGVVHAPARGETFIAAHGCGAFLNGARLVTPTREALTGAAIVAPRFMHEALARAPQNFTLAPRVPSLALRLVDVAAARHDAVIAAPNAQDWDIAAADIILSESGALLREGLRTPLLYNRPQLGRGTLIAAAQPLMDDMIALAQSLSEGNVAS